MNVLHEWDDIVIVDKVIIKEMKGSQVTFCPYVPNGRFKDALSTCTGWEHSDVIFAHQEFQGSIFQDQGDKPPEDTAIYSGHIHNYRKMGNYFRKTQ